MAVLKKQPPAAASVLEASPFFSRNYGGYSNAQLGFIRDHLPESECPRIADPMAGQAYLLSQLALEGAALFLYDYNPALLLLAALRDPRLIRRRIQLRAALRNAVSRTKALWNVATDDYSEQWLPEWSRKALASYARATELVRYRGRGLSVDYWRDLDALFYGGIALIAARLITTFRGSDNLSWLKPGGFRQPTAFGEILEACCEEWFAFAETAAQTTTVSGRITARVSDILSHGLRVRTPVDAIVTSPPYANRLDYTRLWAPEVAVFEALIGPPLVALKRQQIGTNVVRSRYPPAKDIARLPRSMIRTLNAIRDDRFGKDSDTYYYPYFANYAIDLMKAIENCAQHVRQRGTFMLFVRDTIRKDVLFGTGSLAEATMRRLGFRVRTKQLHVVRAHVGLRRKGEAGGLFGLAQREWWLCFERV